MKSKTHLLTTAPNSLPTAVTFDADCNTIIIKQQCCEVDGKPLYSWQLLIISPEMAKELWDLIDDHIDDDMVAELIEENNVH